MIYAHPHKQQELGNKSKHPFVIIVLSIFQTDPLLHLKKNVKQPFTVCIKPFFRCDDHIAKIRFRSVHELYKCIVIFLVEFFYHLSCHIESMNIMICRKTIMIGVVQHNPFGRDQIIVL